MNMPFIPKIMPNGVRKQKATPIMREMRGGVRETKMKYGKRIPFHSIHFISHLSLPIYETKCKMKRQNKNRKVKRSKKDGRKIEII